MEEIAFNDADEEKEYLEWRVRKITRKAFEIHGEIGKLAHRGPGSQDFSKQIENLHFSDEICIVIGIILDKDCKSSSGWDLEIHDRMFPGDFSLSVFKDVEKFLLNHAPYWQKIANEIENQFGMILPKVSKIRRDILYPESAKMEKEIEELKARTHTLEADRERISHNYDVALKGAVELKGQLAEKEKEIKLFITYLQGLEEFFEKDCSVGPVGFFDKVFTEEERFSLSFQARVVLESVAYLVVDKKKKLEEKEKEIDALRGTIFSLEAQISMQENKSDHETERFLREIGELKKETESRLAEKEKKIEELKNSDRKAIEAIRALREYVDALEKTKEALKSEVAEKEKELKEIATARDNAWASFKAASENASEKGQFFLGIMRIVDAVYDQQDGLPYEKIDTEIKEIEPYFPAAVPANELFWKVIRRIRRIGELKKEAESQLVEKEKEIKELKEKTRYLANDIWRWFAELKKISSILNKSKAFFKSGTVAEARKQAEKIADEMHVIIKTWSI